MLRFQTVELTAADTVPTLTWNQWEVTKTDNQPTIEHVTLAETPVELAYTSDGQRLEVVCGRQGMPEVTWNGRRLHATIWQVSAEARALQRLSAGQLPTAFLGRLGLVNYSHTTTFTQPRLAYL